MDTLTIVASVRQKFDLLRPIMTERMRRQWAASEALALPRGGMTLVSQATGLSRTTIWAGVRELQNPSASPRRVNDPRRSRREGGGRHLVEVNDPRLPEDLERLVDPATRGDPISPLRWTCKRRANSPTSYNAEAMMSATRRWRCYFGLGIQPPVQSQNTGRWLPPRSQCPVRVYRFFRF